MINDPAVLPEEVVASVQHYIERRHGGQALTRARSIGPGATIKEISLSGLRGRGGGGFPTGRKWSGLRHEEAGTGDRFVVCNGAEGEPGTFKDRAILRRDPYQVVEGLAVAALAVGARAAYLCVKEKFEAEIAVVSRALEEMAAAGLTGDVPITLVSGPDHYLYGEEKGLLAAIEGDAPLPRVLPPYVHGLFATAPQLGWSSRAQAYGFGPDEDPSDDDDVGRSNPTLVNNVETLATVTHVLTRGPEWHRSLGTERSPGAVVATVVGDVRRPAVAEVELGRPLGEVIEELSGGVAPGRRIKAVFSGVANGVIRGDQLDTPMTYESLAAIGSGLGSCGFIVYDDTADMACVAAKFSRFLYVESCGQCPACKFGTGEVTSYLERIVAGLGAEADVETIGRRLETVTDGNRCYLPVEEQLVVGSILREFPEDLAAHLEGRPLAPRPYPMPKIDDLGDGRVVYDRGQERKQPDWTYTPDPAGG
ncbi:MAG TPA: NADH-ubiquinone oxidoreductase-F iron-sulfur binding region domain-containing protein [Acidimicrobiales bacterium]|nr:NADH-ubiquinone oxidoreductase-F iron-sulfur binding region domain-containing protein [Acidimicrobiales bacterium]